MKVLVSAFEHSANIHLKSLRKELDDDVKFVGIFDKDLGTPIVDLRSLAVMGFVDVIKKIGFFLKLNKTMVEMAAEADKVLLIDSSGFNLPLAKKIKKRFPQKEVIYYILPQAWAWKKKRIPVLAKTCDHLASILPFEKEYYPEDAPIQYVGHPLLDQIHKFKDSLNDDIKTILFMPGSRKGEITKLMPIFHQLLEKLDCKALIAIPEYFTKEERKEIYGDLSKFTVIEDAHEALYEADFAFICSGTATLEAALIGTPFILSYIAKSFDYFVATKFVKIDEVGLGNIMFRKFDNRAMHPEFLQEDVTVSHLYESFIHYNRENFLEDSKSLRKYLQFGSSKNVAKIIHGDLIEN